MRLSELAEITLQEYQLMMQDTSNAVEVQAGHNIDDIDLLVSAACRVRKDIETIIITYSNLPFSSGQRLDYDMRKKLLYMECSLLETIIPFLEPDIYSTQKIQERLLFVKSFIKQIEFKEFKYEEANELLKKQQEEILLNTQKIEDERILQEKVTEMYKE